MNLMKLIKNKDFYERNIYNNVLALSLPGHNDEPYYYCALSSDMEFGINTQTAFNEFVYSLSYASKIEVLERESIIRVFVYGDWP